MPTYYRPNLKAPEKDLLQSLVHDRLRNLSIDSPEFAKLFKVYCKLQESKCYTNSPTPYKPNLTPERKALLADLVTERLRGLSVESPDFSVIYSVHLKLQESKPFNA